MKPIKPKQLDFDIRDYPIDRDKEYHVLSGKLAFELKSTHGLPLSMIADVCFTNDVIVDLHGYQIELMKHRLISRKVVSDTN